MPGGRRLNLPCCDTVVNRTVVLVGTGEEACSNPTKLEINAEMSIESESKSKNDNRLVAGESEDSSYFKGVKGVSSCLQVQVMSQFAEVKPNVRRPCEVALMSESGEH